MAADTQVLPAVATAPRHKSRSAIAVRALAAVPIAAVVLWTMTRKEAVRTAGRSH